MNQLDNKQVDKKLVQKIRQFIIYSFEEQDSYIARETNLFESLSQGLKGDLITQVYVKVLSKMSMFMDNFSQSFIFSLASIIKEISFAPGEYIWQVYFILCFQHRFFIRPILMICPFIISIMERYR